MVWQIMYEVGANHQGQVMKLWKYESDMTVTKREHTYGGTQNSRIRTVVIGYVSAGDKTYTETTTRDDCSEWEGK